MFAVNVVRNERGELLDSEGLECQVIETPDPTKLFSKRVEVQVIERLFNGERFKVYPQQCYLIPESATHNKKVGA